MELLFCWFFSSWNLLRPDFCLWTCYLLIFLFLKLIHRLYPLETDFVHGTGCVLILFSQNLCMLIFLFFKVVNWFFLSHESDFIHEAFCKLTLLIYGTCCLLILFVKHVACWFFPLVKLVHSFSLLVKLNLFMKLLRAGCCSWSMLRAVFLFVKHFAYSFFSKWNLHIDFSPHETVVFVEPFGCWLYS